MKRCGVLLAGMVLLALTAAVNAGPSYTVWDTDNFDGYGPGTENWGGANGWVTSNVDLIGAGTIWDYLHGNGLYVDLAGTSAGSISKTWIDAPAGEWQLEFWVAGNNVAASYGNPEQMTATIAGDGTMTLPREWNAPFGLQLMSFSRGSVGPLTVTFSGDGSDAAGALLDNVTLRYSPVVPTPGALLLTGLGTAVVGAFRRRAL